MLVSVFCKSAWRGGAKIVLIWPHDTIDFLDKSDQIFVIMAQMTIPLSASIPAPELLPALVFLFFIAVGFKQTLCLDTDLKQGIIKRGDNHCCWPF